MDEWKEGRMVECIYTFRNNNNKINPSNTNEFFTSFPYEIAHLSPALSTIHVCLHCNYFPAYSRTGTGRFACSF